MPSHNGIVFTQMQPAYAPFSLFVDMGLAPNQLGEVSGEQIVIILLRLCCELHQPLRACCLVASGCPTVFNYCRLVSQHHRSRWTAG